jgi:DnaJ-class molecular chaperone
MKMFADEPQGDGKCAACHGTGFSGFFEMFFESTLEQQPQCDECQGTGKCPTCTGIGVVEEYELKLAA